MINRASVPVCGNARKSAGPAKCPGKKNDTKSDTKKDSLPIRFYLHKEFRAAEIRFSLHKEFCAAEIRFSLHKEFSTVMDLEAMGAILMKMADFLKENVLHIEPFWI